MLPAPGLTDAVAGRVEMRQPWSPFGVSVDRDGHLLYDLHVTIDGPPAALAAERYVAWLASSTLDVITPLGVIAPEAPLRATSSLNRILVLITKETGDVGSTWRGPIVLRGRSRSALLQSLMGHSIFNRAEM